jgi:hypothetical protein
VSDLRSLSSTRCADFVFVSDSGILRSDLDTRASGERSLNSERSNLLDQMYAPHPTPPHPTNPTTRPVIVSLVSSPSSHCYYLPLSVCLSVCLCLYLCLPTCFSSLLLLFLFHINSASLEADLSSLTREKDEMSSNATELAERM